MRFSSQSFQRSFFFCTTAVTTPSVSMRSCSSNDRGRGNLWSRCYCERPLEQQPPPPPDAEFVSGDPHLGAISASNYGHRRGHENGYEHRRPPYPTTGLTPQLRPLPQARFRPSPPRFWIPSNNENNSSGFNSTQPPGWCRPQFGAPPSGFSRHDFQGSHPQTGGNHQANSRSWSRPPHGFRPHQGSPPPFRTKPADFREWVSSSTQPPPQAERLKILSYNILADYLARDHRHKLYFHIPRHILDWEWRKRRILVEFGLWSPDILCLQEVDRFQDLEQELLSRGYRGTWKMRTGSASDGCATFWRADRFELLNEESIEFNKLGLRDNVAQICVLELKAVGKGSAQSFSGSVPASLIESSKAKRIVVCNIHVLYNPKRGEIKLGQVRTLIDRAHSVSKHWNNAPVIICGDFNSTPKSPLYNFILQKKLDLSDLARDQISGQYSSALPLPSVPVGSGYRWFGPPAANNDLKEVHSAHKSEGESHGTLSSMLPAQCLESLDVITKPFSHQGGSSKHEELATSKNQTRLGTDLRNCIIHNSDEKVVLNQPYQCNQLDASCGASLDISKQEVGVEGKYYSTDANSELIKSHSEINAKEDGTEFSVSSRISPAELSVLTIGDDDTKEQNFVRGIHRTEKKLDLGLLKEINQISSVMENISSPEGEVHPPHSHQGYVLAHEEMGRNSTGNKPYIELEEHITDRDLENNDGMEDDVGSTVQDSQINDNSTSDFLAELHGTDETLWDQLNSQFHCHVQNPFSWTPVESEIASGNKDCTLLRHSLKLKSAYAEVGDLTRTKDSGGEPQATSYNRLFMGTVDYIWFSDGLHAAKVLNTIPKDVLQRTRGFPTPKWGSDHIALVCELAFYGDEQKHS